jgi:uncharacterized membrane protein (DUF373 family)
LPDPARNQINTWAVARSSDRSGSRQVTDVVRPAGETRQNKSPRRDALSLFEHLERAVEVGIALILGLVAILALAGAATLAWEAVAQWPQIRSLFVIVDRLLFVLMVIEILHTVRASIQTHQMSSEPFLIVGLIATIRRILVVTLETSDKATEGPAGASAALSFEHAMIELGILAMLTLVLAIAIYLSRRTRS